MAGPNKSDKDRSYVAGTFDFQLDGVKCGFIKSFEGGIPTAEVVTEKLGTDYYARKHLGPLKYEDITMNLGFACGKPVNDWISQTLQQNFSRKNGALNAANFKNEIMFTREFFNALITEIGFAACDGSSKEAAYLTLKFAPEYTRYKQGDGKKIGGEFGKNEQKLWLPSNFRLKIDGLDCTKVNKIDAITIKQAAVTDDIGDARDYEKVPGAMEFPNLKITLSEQTADAWYKWHEEFVIKGNNDETMEKGGTLELLTSNRTEVLCTLTFGNLGIFKLTPDKSEGHSTTIRRQVAELYMERASVAFGSKVIG